MTHPTLSFYMFMASSDIINVGQKIHTFLIFYLDSIRNIIIPPDWQLLLEYPLDTTQYLHRADEYKSFLVGQHWSVH